MNANETARLRLEPLQCIAIKQLRAAFLLPVMLLLLSTNGLIAQQNCNSPTDPITGCNIMYCDGSMCDDLVPADGVSTCTSCQPCGVESPPSDRYACARVELDLTSTPEYAADPTLTGCDLTLDTQENGNFDFYVNDGSINCGTPDFQIGDGQTIPINVVTGGMVELIVCKTGGSGRRDLNILLSCCTPPSITCPDDVTVECDDSTDPAATGNATSMDGCGTVAITFNDDFVPGCGSGTGITTRTFTATDDNGSTATCDQIITIVDTTPPVITCPADFTIECGDSTDPNSTGLATGTDGCGTVTITFVDTFTAGCGTGTGSISREFTATDACGNTADCRQIITIVDTAPPSITCPPDATVECGMPTDPNATGTATASDACGGAAITFSDSSSPGCGNTETITRTWTATDDCGNSASCTQIINVVDTTPPTITCPPDATVECGMPTDPNATGTATASEACGGAAITFSDNSSPGCGNTETITRTWTATDDCGNSASCTQIINVVDITPPTITCPPDATVECGMPTDPNATGTATASEACGGAAITFSDNSSPGCGNTETITRTWTATDDCGNSASCTQIINVVDTTPPAVTCADFTATFEGCPGGLGANTPNGVWIRIGDDLGFTAASGGSFILFLDLSNCVDDNCSDLADLEVTLFTSYEEDRTNCAVTLVNEFSVRDECGNISDDRIITRFTIQNTSQAVITCPADVTIECGDSTDPADTGMATASDNCGSSTPTFSDQFTPACGNSGTITRTWTANADCGSPATCVQIITIVDTAPPSITCPPDATVECGMPTDPNATGTATASEACGGAAITFSDNSSPGCGNTETITRTWTATDDCGNSASCTQIINVVDTTPPTITCPPDATVECGMPTDPNATGTATASEACGGAAITFSDSSSPGCGNTETITRTWTATDDCGNSASCTQIINVVDTTPPTIICPPDATVECGMPTAPNATGNATGDDTCGGVTITFSDSFVAACGNTGTITRTFTATDDCGNMNTCDQLIVIVDTTDPIIAGPLPDGATMNVECNLRDPNWTPFVITTDDLTIMDNCSERPDITVTYEDILEEEGECGVSDFLSLWRCVWTATDECGNSTTYTIFLRIVDTQGPVFTFFPADVGIECDEEVPFQQATAEDACSEVTVSFVDSRINGDCANNYTIRRRWTAVDGCGNPTVADQFINVSDTTTPVLDFTDGYVSDYTDGQDIFTDCSEFGNIINLSYAVSANDNCSGATAVSFEYEDFGLFNCAEVGYSGYVQTTWTSTDECGNTASVSLNWFLVDQTPPSLQGVPDDECVTSLPPAPNVQAVDDCEFASLEYTQSDPVDCDGGQYVDRTWTATDVCGNTTSASQRIIITDGSGVGPTVNVDYPGLSGLASGSTAQLAAECNPDGTWMVPDFAGAVEANTGCGSVELSTNLELLDSGDCSTTGYIARYQLEVAAADLCGNATEYRLFIELIDATPPVVDSPAELVLDCGEAIPEISARDACNEVVSITFVDSQPMEASCPDSPQSFNRVWTVIDACDNVTIFPQSITIIDNTGPVLSNIPADACNDETIATPVTAFDECSGTEVMVEVSESTTNEAGCGQILTRTWTATDACGNTSTATQQVFFADDTAPVLTFAHPLLVGLEDGEELILPVDFDFGNPQEIYDFGEEAIEISDNCASNLTAVLSVAFLDEEEDCSVTGYLSRIRLTWNVTDPCGNSAKISIILVYEDTYPPEIFFVPDDVVLYCTDLLPGLPDILVKDNYDENLEAIFSQESVDTDFGTRIIRRWTATDQCGNSTVEEQFIDIYDNTLECAFDVPNLVFCNSDGNEITVNASGGTAPYTYSWEMTDCDGFLTSDPTQATVTYTVGYTTQNFSVTITDANDCQRVCTISVVCEKPDDESGGDVPQFNIYPNPVDALLTLKFTSLAEKPVKVSIYSLFGQVIFQQNVLYWPQDGYGIDTQSMPNGTYLIKLESDGIDPLVQQVVVLH